MAKDRASGIDDLNRFSFVTPWQYEVRES